jgi:sulfite exporter TauE/SafE
MNPYFFALLTGLLSGGHCLAMCGPLAFAIPSANRGWLLAWDKFQYQAGRVCSYVFLGLAAGLIGHQLWMSGLQRTLSISTGIILLASALSIILPVPLPLTWLFNPLNKLLSFALQKRAGHFTIGILNGFLPCGMVWMAMAGAINMGSPLKAMGYMAVFGAGTIPLLFAAMLGANWITPFLRRRLAKAGPVLMILIGCWLIVRAPLVKRHKETPAAQKAPVSWCGKEAANAEH